VGYIKTVWKNGESPAINKDNLNKIEQGIYDAQLYGADAGGDDTYVVNLSASALFAGMTIRILVTTGNTGACSLSIDNGTTTKDIKKVLTSGVAALSTGDMPANSIATLAYDGTQWLLQNVNVLGVYTTAGDMAYATAANVITRLGIGTKYQNLRVNAGATAPEWGDSTWEKIAETTTSGSASQVDFSSIASGYKYFKITFSCAGTGLSGYDIDIRFNDDSTGTNYHYTRLRQTQTTVDGLGATQNGSIVLANATYKSGDEAVEILGEILIRNRLAASGKAKQVFAKYGYVLFGGVTASYQAMISGQWLDTANEITKISLIAGLASDSNFVLSGAI
jgi:hypothetical protein